MNNLSLGQESDSLRALLVRRVAQWGDKDFLLSAEDRRRWSYAEFLGLVNRTANLLAAGGVGRGNVVSLLLPNSPEYVAAYFACFSLGALAGPINLLLKADEVAYAINHSEAKALLINSEFRPLIDNTRHDLPTLRAVIEFDDLADATKDFSETPGDSWRELRLTRDDEAIIIYTSGTTGQPKGCLLTHGNLLANARQIAGWMGFTPADRLLTLMPLFHMNAVTVTTLTALYAGGSTIVVPRFSASRFWRQISDYGATSFGSVATMLSMLLAKYPDGVPAEYDTSRLRFAMCGSAPVPAEVLRRFEETFGCLVIEGYGLSESTCRATFNPPDARRRPGSCGLPIGNEMRVYDEEDGELPDNEPGEIVLRGENIFKGYFKNEDATARAFRGGWFHTGDIGFRDGEGFYHIVDRKSDMIIRGGENIYPRKIDEVLYQHRAVAEAAAVGVPDELYGEEVAAFVVFKAGSEASAAEIIEHCRAHLAEYKCPKIVHFVSDLPKGPTGKLLKRELSRHHQNLKEA